MTSRATRLRVAGLLFVCAALLFVGIGHADDVTAAGFQSEVRGLWVLRSSLTSPYTIAAMIRSAHANGFNTLFVQVRGRGDAYYASALEPRAADLAAQAPGFDPLQDVIDQAHAGGMRVHAWINVNLVASAAEVPADKQHIIYRHPDWLMVPRAVVQELTYIDGHSPAYAGKISRWIRAQPAGQIEGLYLSPILPDAAAYTERVVRDLVSRYDLDGVHLDYLRYPSDDFDYSRYAVELFKQEVRPTLTPAVRTALDTRAKVDPFAYPDALQDRWTQFRRSRLNSLAMRLRSAVKGARPKAVLTAAVSPDFNDAYDVRLQDWRTWIENGIIDAVCPMAYTSDAQAFANLIAGAHAIAGPRPVWAGIGAWRLSPAQTLQHIALARRAGAAGLVLFSYDSLTGPAQARTDYLEEVSRGAFAATAASVSGAR
jgi:uncharacterized lipoprotein YddW (UPF0748 family)